MYVRSNYYSWGSSWQEDGKMRVNLIDTKTNDVLWTKYINANNNTYTSSYKTGDHNTAYVISSSETIDLKSYNAEEFKIVMTGNSPLNLTNVKLHFN